MKVVLDTNIYDKLAIDEESCQVVVDAIKAGFLKIIVTRTVAEELYKSPFKGIPDFFDTVYEPNTVAIAGIMESGDRLGSGDIYYEHKGESKKENDAFIVDAAAVYADYVVSEDIRLRKRVECMNINCQAKSYLQFIQIIQNANS